MFAPLYKLSAVYSPVKICKESVRYQALTVKAEEKEAIYIEEEEEEDDERDAVKKYSGEFTNYALPYSPKYFSQHLESSLSFHKSFFHSTFSRSPYLIFCVFRL